MGSVPAHNSAQLNNGGDLRSLQTCLYEWGRCETAPQPGASRAVTSLPYRQEMVRVEVWAAEASSRGFCIRQSASLCVGNYKDIKLEEQLSYTF